MTATAELAKHFLSASFANLASDHFDQMKRLLLDYCGVALAGRQTDSGEIAGRFVIEMGGVAQATVIGTNAKAPAPHAAFANAVAEHSLEMDDVDDLALFHYGPPIVSAALAVAEWKDISGAELLNAMVAGSEMMNRLSLATNPELRDRGFHTTPTCGVFGATVASAVIMGLDEELLVSALGLAGAQASGLMEMYGPSMQKRINPGPAARDGVSSAILAELGFTGADTILEGERGFAAAFAGGLDVEKLLADLGVTIPVPVEFKPYAAARPIHNAIDCALLISQRESFAAEDVAQIVVHRHPDWAHYHLNNSPESYHEAQMSLPYSVAIALIDGHAMPSQYSDEQLLRKDLMALTKQVAVKTDPDLPRGVSCHMMVTLVDGTVYESQVDDPKGSLRNPMSAEELAQKFLTLASPVVGSAQATEIVDMIGKIEIQTSIRPLTELLRTSGARHAA